MSFDKLGFEVLEGLAAPDVARVGRTRFQCAACGNAAIIITTSCNLLT